MADTLASVKKALNERITKFTKRVDAFGEQLADHEERIASLEARPAPEKGDKGDPGRDGVDAVLGAEPLAESELGMRLARIEADGLSNGQKIAAAVATLTALGAAVAALIAGGGGGTPTTTTQPTTTVPVPAPSACTSTVGSISAAESALVSAKAADVVCLSDGAYGSVSLAGKAAGATLSAVHPGQVTVGSVRATGSGYTVSGLKSSSATCASGASNIVFDQMRITGEASAYGSTSTRTGPCTWQGSEIGPPTGSGEKDSTRCWVNCYGVTWRDNLIHVADEGGGHNDGLQGFGGGHGIRFVGNRFVGGLGSQGFFLKDGTYTNVIFSDNLIVNRGNNSSGNTANPFQVYKLIPDSADPFYSGYGLVMEHNTIWGNGNISYFRDCGGLNYLVRYNVLDGLTAAKDSDVSSCIGPWVAVNVSDEQDFNVLKGTGTIKASGPHDTAIAPTFVGGEDWRLSSGSAGITWNPVTRRYGP